MPDVDSFHSRPQLAISSLRKPDDHGPHDRAKTAPSFEGVPSRYGRRVLLRRRASAGLIVSEGTSPSAAGIGYVRTTGRRDPGGRLRGWKERSPTPVPCEGAASMYCS